MKITKCTFTALVFVLALCSAYAQNPPPVELPKIISPPPEAAAFIRYGEIPVDYSTGVPKIDIPLFTLRSGKLQLPISISYHASGIKVRDIASPVGLGWVLNAGGLVTRTIIGLEDNLNPKLTYKSSAELTNAISNASTYQARASLGTAIELDLQHDDTQSDRYYFQLPNGMNQVFRYPYIDSEDTPGDGIFKAPYSPVKIQKVNGPYSSWWFNITDNDGTKYIMDVNEPMSWQISKMISADQKDEINFYYRLGNSSYNDWNFTHTLSHGNWYTSACNLVPNDQFNKTWDAGTSGMQLLDSIVSADAVVTFQYISDRPDKASARLTKVQLYQRFPRVLIKEYSLLHSYFGTQANNNRRLRLDGLQAKDAGQATVQQYSFAYNGTPLPPYTDPQNQQFYEDFWGYYNGVGGKTLIPYQYLPAEYRNLEFYMSDRSVDPVLGKACMIESITYPTGGKTVYEFEPNTGVNYYYPYPYGTILNGYGGGFRVKSIKDYTQPGADPIVKTYVYDGVVAQNITSDLFTYTQPFRFYACYGTYDLDREIIMATPLYPLSVRNGSSAIYTQVTEYNGDQYSNNGKTVYSYSAPPSGELVEFSHPRFKDSYQWDSGIYTPQLLSKYVYKNVNGSDQILQTTDNTYADFNDYVVSTGMKIDQTRTYVSYTSFDPHWDWGYLYDFSYSDTKLFEKVSLLTSTTTGDYSNLSAPVVQTTNYTYNLENLQPVEKTVHTSAGSIISRYKYPHDLRFQAPYNAMYNLHMWSPVLEQTDYKNSIASTPLKSTKVNYAYWNSNPNQIYPETIQTPLPNGSYENRIRYHAYDSKGNVMTVSKENGPKTHYIYSYGGQYPIAKIENAEYSSIESLLGGTSAIEAFRNRTPSEAEVISFLAPLRTNLSGAQVTTYTYKPLVGMTSMTDPAGHKTTYEYDTFQRLSTVRDQNGNVLKKTDYHYKP